MHLNLHGVCIQTFADCYGWRLSFSASCTHVSVVYKLAAGFIQDPPPPKNPSGHIHVHVLPWVCCVCLFGLASFFDLSYSLMSCILTNVCVCYSYRLVLRCTRWLSSCWSSPSQTTTPYSTCPLSWQLPLSTSHARSVGMGNG